MKSIYHFLRLTRFANLLVIGLTMCVFQLFISKYLIISIAGNWEKYSFKDLFDSSILGDAGFLLLMLSTLLIAAAGNIINDYFDVKADRVNKPERLIVGRHIKRRWAMLFHWSFNSIGILIAAYISYVHQNWMILVISFVSINILWFYSAVYKRKFLSGNLMVAFLIALVPLYVLAFNMNHLYVDCGLDNTYSFDAGSFIVRVTTVVATIAFLINLNREIIKDIADVRGDMHMGAKTIPIRLGLKRAKAIVLFISGPLIGIIAYYYFFVWEFNFYALEGGSLGLPPGVVPISPIAFGSLTPVLILSIVMIIASTVTLLVSDKRRFLLLSSNFLKLAMLFGLLSPLFL